ncbi:hypothetical protein ElyMa_003368200 [Elysia marginata]|uniref:Uncharacterized protein n=1 Tax=Elysia marginata TaxID=1093978 RepID=A0AAV4JIK2_9GAST|nr:hypothetical protein ElyMa_003368200 [Elysia marginata]
MLARSSAEILDTSMDASLEIEEDTQGMDWNGDLEDTDAPDEGQDDDVDIICIDDKVPEVFNVDSDLQNVSLPDEVTRYIESLTSETRNLENELKECDELLQYSPNKPHVSSAVIPYDDFKDIEEAARMRGMTVDEFQQKVLEELKQNQFNQEEIDEEYEEFLQMQREFAELRADLYSEKPPSFPNTLAIEGANSSSADIDNQIALTSASTEDAGEFGHSEGDRAMVESNGVEETTALVKYVGSEDDIDKDDIIEAGPVSINMAALSSMRDFILEQLRRNEEFYERKRQHLVDSIENLRHEEEKEMLRTEERRKNLEDQLQEKKEALRLRRETDEALLEEETKVRQELTSQELSQHQLEIDRLSEALVEERRQFETNERQWRDRLADTRAKAALKIQKVFRGRRARRQHVAELAEMAELRELRVKEKHTLRLMELESKAEAEEKRKRAEEERQKEKERKEKEEAERIAGLIQKEKERMEEEARQAEIKRKKEEEEEHRIIEEKKKKEEEKRQREEEKKRQKEEEKQKKEEEKKRKEEEKRKKKEEKQKKDEEKKKQEQEEKNEVEKGTLKSEDNSAYERNDDSQQSCEKTDSKKLYENFVTENIENTEETNNATLTGKTELISPTMDNSKSSSEVHVSPADTADNNAEVVMKPDNTNTTKAVSSKSEAQGTMPSLECKSPALESNGKPEKLKPKLLQKQHQQTAEKVRLSSPRVSVSTTAVVQLDALSSSTAVTTAAAASLQSDAPTTAAAAETTVVNSVKTANSVPSPSQIQSQPQPPTSAPEPTAPPQPSASELKRLAWIKSCIPWR